jgi:hypothetical protein
MTAKDRIRSYPHDEISRYFAGSREHLEDPNWTFAPHLVANVNENCAIFAYALGEPLEEVKRYARDAMTAYRGAQGKRRSLEQFARPPKGVTFDDSITASNVSLTFLYWGLLTREEGMTRAVAENTWDPPAPVNPTIFPVFRIAYAVRDLVLDRPAEALVELGRMKASAKKHELLQARALNAIARAAGEDFSKALDELARTHRKATSQEYLPELKMFCLSAGGLASLAIDRGLVTPENLPTDIDCFPRELVLDGRG